MHEFRRFAHKFNDWQNLSRFVPNIAASVDKPAHKSHLPMLILASKSPVRKGLLRQAGLSFTCETPQINERAIEEKLNANPKETARALAREKALKISHHHPGALVIGADQTLECDGETLHKPENMAVARQQLLALRGKTHTLFAAVALTQNGTVLWDYVDEAHLTMRHFSAEELNSVLALEGDAILGSVGAYRLEGATIQLFDKIEGDYFTILGLPLLKLLAGLRTYAPEVFKEKP